MSSDLSSVYLASGCFWGTEHIFLKEWPKLSTRVGYTGGKVDSPTYKAVCSGSTEHAEAIKVEFDPAKITFEQLIEHFYRTHDPTTVNRQGGDRGTQYRSAIFTTTPEQYEAALRVTEEIQQKRFDPKGQKIVTIIQEAGPWWDAEDYHQKYLHKNPHGYQCPTHRYHW